MSYDAVKIVRTDLVRRIDAIAASAGRITLAALCEQVDSIRRTARVHSLDAVERLASLLESAVAYHGHGPIIHSYLDLMRDAAECPDQGPDVCATYAAALSSRMGAPSR